MTVLPPIWRVLNKMVYMLLEDLMELGQHGQLMIRKTFAPLPLATVPCVLRIAFGAGELRREVEIIVPTAD